MIDRQQIEKLYSAAKLSDTEKSVLEYLLNNIEHIEEGGVRAVAQACYTSMTTVLRLAKKLGYTGYREMAFDLKRLQNTSNELNSDLNNSHTHFSFRPDDLNLFVEALGRHNVLGVNGEGYSRLIAEYMRQKLVGVGRTAVMQDYLETEQFIEAFKDKLDLMILVSKSGQTPAIIDMARLCRESNILVAAFTGNSSSDLADKADILFTVKDDHPFDIKNAQPNCFTGYCILAFEELLSLSASKGI